MSGTTPDLRLHVLAERAQAPELLKIRLFVFNLSEAPARDFLVRLYLSEDFDPVNNAGFELRGRRRLALGSANAAAANYEFSWYELTWDATRPLVFKERGATPVVREAIGLVGKPGDAMIAWSIAAPGMTTNKGICQYSYPNSKLVVMSLWHWDEIPSPADPQPSS